MIRRIFVSILLVVLVVGVSFAQEVVFRNIYTGPGTTGTNTINGTQIFNTVGCDTIVYVVTNGDTLAANFYLLMLGNYSDQTAAVVSTAKATGTWNRTTDTTFVLAYPFPENIKGFPRAKFRMTGTSGNCTAFSGTMRVDAALIYKQAQKKTASRPE